MYKSFFFGIIAIFLVTAEALEQRNAAAEAPTTEDELDAVLDTVVDWFNKLRNKHSNDVDPEDIVESEERETIDKESNDVEAIENRNVSTDGLGTTEDPLDAVFDSVHEFFVQVRGRSYDYVPLPITENSETIDTSSDVVHAFVKRDTAAEAPTTTENPFDVIQAINHLILQQANAPSGSLVFDPETIKRRFNEAVDKMKEALDALTKN